eukprot:4461509-Pyramimonas_sp.AAC.1
MRPRHRFPRTPRTLRFPIGSSTGSGTHNAALAATYGWVLRPANFTMRAHVPTLTPGPVFQPVSFLGSLEAWRGPPETENGKKPPVVLLPTRGTCVDSQE